MTLFLQDDAIISQYSYHYVIYKTVRAERKALQNCACSRLYFIIIPGKMEPGQANRGLNLFYHVIYSIKCVRALDYTCVDKNFPGPSNFKLRFVKKNICFASVNSLHNFIKMYKMSV